MFSRSFSILLSLPGLGAFSLDISRFVSKILDFSRFSDFLELHTFGHDFCNVGCSVSSRLVSLGAWGLASFLWSRLIKAFLTYQVVEDEPPLELIHRDATVAELFVQDRLTRRSSHSLRQPLVSPLEQLAPSLVTRGTLPTAVRLAPLEDVDECIVELSDYTLCLANRRINRAVPLFFLRTSLSSRCWL